MVLPEYNEPTPKELCEQFSIPGFVTFKYVQPVEPRLNWIDRLILRLAERRED